MYVYSIYIYPFIRTYIHIHIHIYFFFFCFVICISMYKYVQLVLPVDLVPNETINKMRGRSSGYMSDLAIGHLYVHV